MSKVINDITNKRFGRLTAIKYVGASKWLCKCDCGNEKIVISESLINGHTKSCGCINKERKANRKKIDNDRTTHALYYKWRGMKQRCSNPKMKCYKFYGGKGIKVCDEWMSSFKNFYNWAIENGYKDIDGEDRDQLQLDRIDSSKDYCPENCRFIPKSENCQRVSISTMALLELLEKSDDEMVKEYLDRKIENNEQIQKEKKAIRGGWFPVRKNNYCYLKNKDATRRFLFKNYKTVALFLNISTNSVYYRIKVKNGIISEEWSLTKITKEEFNELSRNVEVIV